VSPSFAQLLFVVAALVGLAGFGAIISVGYSGRNIRIQRQLDRVTAHDPTGMEAGWFDRLCIALGRRTLRSREVQDLARLTQSAGYLSPSTPYQVAALQAGGGIALAIAGIAMSMSLAFAMPLPVFYALAGASIGYLIPRLGLRIMARRRRRRIRRELPFFIDMLLLLLRSGASIDRCFREISSLAHDAIPEIHRTVGLLLADLDQGRSYEESLDRWADRMSDPSAYEIARQLQQAMAHGTELSKALGQFSQRLIAQMLSSGRERVGRRSTHVTVATLLFFMPPLVVVLAAPGVSSVIRLLANQ
jgi:tight adherence protein C